MSYVKIVVDLGDHKVIVEKSTMNLRMADGSYAKDDGLPLLHEAVEQIERALTKEVPR